MTTTAQLAQLAQAVYADTGAPSGWERRGNSDPNPSGYFGAAFRNKVTGEIVVAHRGTEPTAGTDRAADIQMLQGKVPDQYQYAQQFLKQVEASYQDAPISITGHSLGGTIAQLQGAKEGYTTVTFNPYGAKELLPDFVARYGDPNGRIAAGDFSNIQNHRTAFDGVSILPGSAQLGGMQTHLAPSELGMMGLSKVLHGTLGLGIAFIWSHSIDRFADEIYRFSNWERDFIAFARRFGGTISGIENALITTLQQSFATAQTTRYDPLTLDLDGDGLETVAGSAGAHFDHDANGFAEQTGWVGKDDGLLVWDRDGNGNIDSGRELFGDQTRLKTGALAANGFAALVEWDGNADGRIDSADALWANLQIWKDADGDGSSDAGELHALSDYRIQALNLANTAGNVNDGLGNTRTQLGSYSKADGSTAQMGNYVFARDTARTLATTRLDLSADLAALPTLAGFGNVHDLDQAMARDASGALKGLVQTYMQTSDPAARAAVFEQLLFKWAGADTVAATSRGGNIDARRLVVLEAFLGQGYSGQNGANPNAPAAPLLNQAYQNLTAMFPGSAHGPDLLQAAV